MYILQVDNYTLLMIYRLPHYRNLRLQGTQDHTLFKVTLTNKRYLKRVRKFLVALLPNVDLVVNQGFACRHLALHINHNLRYADIRHRIESGKFIKAFGG